MNQTELFIGVDVSKNHLDVAFDHLENAPVERFQNAPDSVDKPVARLQQLADRPGVHRRLRAAATHKARLSVAQVVGARLYQGRGARPTGWTRGCWRALCARRRLNCPMNSEPSWTNLQTGESN
jgi:hypothetical protein